MESFDIVMIGHVSQDIIVFRSIEEHLLGGAVVYSSAAASRSGASVCVVTKATADEMISRRFFQRIGVEARMLPSKSNTSIRNEYASEDRERRTVTLITRAEPFRLDDVSELTARIYHLAGLFVGEIPDELIEPLAIRGEIALDVQGVVRRENNGRLESRDWSAKSHMLPLVTYLKADAAESQIVTGVDDRDRAARILHDLGAREVMITHNEEVIVYDGTRTHRAPFTPENLSGRTGRGDTCFAAYLAWRFDHTIEESVAYAAALTSMKMETAGPFAGSIEAVLDRMHGSSV
ncbi:MAG TPA: PfkB family carbohydrate kinase [Spirochaetia bacterium]|nr:PfkB family carbohydrate kinase [Spirochaetia bacterium]